MDVARLSVGTLVRLRAARKVYISGLVGRGPDSMHIPAGATALVTRWGESSLTLTHLPGGELSCWTRFTDAWEVVETSDD